MNIGKIVRTRTHGEHIWCDIHDFSDQIHLQLVR